MSALRLFYDTNILLDYIGRKGKNAQSADLIGAMQAFGDVVIWVSAKSYTDTLYVLNKYRSSLSVQDALLESLRTLTLCSLDADDIQTACAQRWPDFEDALIAVGAEKVKADYIITRDKDFSRSRIPTLTPDELLTMMRVEQRLTYDIISIDEVLQDPRL
jgi:predicted nucleic acid-binding protein